MDLTTILGSGAAVAIVTGLFKLIERWQDRKNAKKDKAEEEGDTERKALRYIMLYIIQERCKEHIADGRITLEERRSIHKWHDLYHDGLSGNGDADALLRQVDALPVDMD